MIEQSKKARRFVLPADGTPKTDPNNQTEDIKAYPQPSPSDDGTTETQPYRYIRYENAESAYFPESAIPLDTLVWVLLSKGKSKVPQLYTRARVHCAEPDAEGRIQVRYPSGSTYRVRRKNLVPVFEELEGLIVVAAETNDYRRMSIVHTRKEDHFIEIGCDYGILVDSVDAKSTLGIDKSEESIDIANERYPNETFLLGDVFEDDLDVVPQNPLVVSIDINGNRELQAVLKCIQLVLDSWSPRLIMVKSRALHAKMVNEGMD
ncbi:unnamed protein product [Pseudo-nitzschia multistriata]|uniref:Methyltransferase domain-containing protein n=1 Tax=Pseudo-nitzschia multistriata TaxID=183589 RepID=A0A448ZHB9_9STRA|nr:unnamed protein product [Pseudo-nitzschia multistriata]